jgi:hypothetical protein
MRGKINNRLASLLTIATILLCMNIATPVAGDWSEDFSDDSLKNWYVWADDWSSNNGPTDMDPTWEFSDGELISGGTYLDARYNHELVTNFSL